MPDYNHVCGNGTRRNAMKMVAQVEAGLPQSCTALGGAPPGTSLQTSTSAGVATLMIGPERHCRVHVRLYSGGQHVVQRLRTSKE